MTQPKTLTHQQASHHDTDDKNIFGFWVYLMTDLIMFASLFATYAVLRNNTFGGISIHEIFNGPFVLTETLVLLTSSLTVGLAMIESRHNKKTTALILFGLTFLLGSIFLVMELTEFTKLFQEGNGFQKSAFLSSFFTLVGTHGLHIATGLFWMLLLMIQTLRRGLTTSILRKLTLFGMFWHFLDIVWIFIFTIVYLMGAK
jgi:cytochrome o ubiquinol oxidase subunit 3